MFEILGIEGKYEVLNPDNLEYDINCKIYNLVNKSSTNTKGKHQIYQEYSISHS